MFPDMLNSACTEETMTPASNTSRIMRSPVVLVISFSFCCFLDSNVCDEGREKAESALTSSNLFRPPFHVPLDCLVGKVF